MREWTAADLLAAAESLYQQRRWECSSEWERPERREIREATAERWIAELRSGALLAEYRARCVELLGAHVGVLGARRLASGDVEPTKAVRFARSWWPQRVDRRWLLLLGSVGVGKTFAAATLRLDRMLEVFDSELEAAAARAIAKTWKEPGGVTGVAPPWTAGIGVLASRLPEHFDPWSDDDDRFGRVDWLVPMLVIEDLGVERLTPRWEATFAELVERRLVAGRTTIITSNLGRLELRPRYGDRIADRWNEVAAVFEITGPSLRGRDGGAGL